SSDAGRTFAPNRKVADYSCECCRIAMAETPERDVAVFWRHIFGENLHIRDHGFAVIGKDRVITPLQWATRDNWELEGCPHHGPSMVSAGDGSYHISWFTLGDERKGIFYGRYHPGTGQLDNLSTMATVGASHPYIARIGSNLMLVWKQFDGDKTNIRLAVSRDDGNTWQPETTVISTSGASDHPLLITHSGAGWLSWHTSDEGLRIIPLNHKQQVSGR
ncbi:MAG: exo-alpha-sialidase, partial [Gammaproteobacteria bacterium]